MVETKNMFNLIFFLVVPILFEILNEIWIMIRDENNTIHLM
jgi:exopolysaccharide biosynthesis protein